MLALRSVERDSKHAGSRRERVDETQNWRGREDTTYRYFVYGLLKVTMIPMMLMMMMMMHTVTATTEIDSCPSWNHASKSIVENSPFFFVCSPIISI